MPSQLRRYALRQQTTSQSVEAPPVALPPLKINDRPIPGATQGVAYNFRLDGDGGKAPYTWAVVLGSLPSGLTLISTGERAGIIEGTPTTIQQTSFTIKLTDSLGEFITQAFTLAVAAKPIVGAAPEFLLINETILHNSRDIMAALPETIPTTATDDQKFYHKLRATWKSKGDNTYASTTQVVTHRSPGQPDPSDNPNDLVSSSLYWHPWVINAIINGIAQCDASQISRALSRNYDSKWTGSLAEYYGTSTTSSWVIDYNFAANDYSFRTLAHEGNDRSKPRTGEPYFNIDKHVNEEFKDAYPAGGWLKSLMKNVRWLGLAYYVSGRPGVPKNENYAKKAAAGIRAWWVTAATRMNPHLKFSGYIPGHNEGKGRPEGAIDLELFPRVMDTLNLIRGCTSWTSSDENTFRIWLRDYLAWMELVTEPSQGQIGNIKAQRDVQYVAILLYLGDHAKAYNFVKNTAFTLFRFQTANVRNTELRTTPFGSFYEEWDREESWGYSTKVLKIWMEYAELISKIVPPSGQAKLDLWNFVVQPWKYPGANPNREQINPATGQKYGPDPNYIAAGGHSIRKCIDFHFTYVLSGAKFSKQTAPNPLQMLTVIRQATYIFKTTQNSAWWTSFLKGHQDDFRNGIETKYTLDDAQEGPVVQFDYRNAAA